MTAENPDDAEAPSDRASRDLVDPFVRLDDALADYREDLWREYQVVQQKIDSATRFRMVIVGWTMTGASVAPIVVARAGLSLTMEIVALGFAALLLLVVHKLAVDQLTTGLHLGRHAKLLEGELQSAKLLRHQILGAISSGGASEKLRFRIAAASSDYQLSRNAQSGGMKRDREELLYVRAFKKCDEKFPAVANAVTSRRLTWVEFVRVVLGLSPRSGEEEARAGGERSSNKPSLPVERERSLIRNLRENVIIIRIQLLFLVAGVAVMACESEAASPLEGETSVEESAPTTPSLSGVEGAPEEFFSGPVPVNGSTGDERPAATGGGKTIDATSARGSVGVDGGTAGRSDPAVTKRGDL